MTTSPNISHIVERMKIAAEAMLASPHDVANRYLLGFLAKAPSVAFEKRAKDFKDSGGEWFYRALDRDFVPVAFASSEDFLVWPNGARQFLCAFEEMELRNLLLATLPPQPSEEGDQAIIHVGTIAPVIIQKLVLWHLLSVGVRQANHSLPAVPNDLRTPALYAASQSWAWGSEELAKFMHLLGLDGFPAETDLKDTHKRVAWIRQKSQEVTDLYIASIAMSELSSYLNQDAKARLEQFIGFLAHEATLEILEPGTIQQRWGAPNNPEKGCFENRLLEQLASLDKKEIARRINNSDLGDFSSLAGLLRFAIDLELKHAAHSSPQDESALPAVAPRR